MQPRSHGSVFVWQVRESVLQSLASVDLEDLPVLVKFLLQSVTSADALEVCVIFLLLNSILKS